MPMEESGLCNLGVVVRKKRGVAVINSRSEGVAYEESTTLTFDIVYTAPLNTVILF